MVIFPRRSGRSRESKAFEGPAPTLTRGRHGGAGKGYRCAFAANQVTAAELKPRPIRGLPDSLELASESLVTRLSVCFD